MTSFYCATWIRHWLWRGHLAIGLSGFEKEIVERADPIIVEGHEIFVATPEDLIVLKVLAGRQRDLQDVKGIVEIQGERLDWGYCLAAAKRLESAVDVDLVQQVERLRTS
ncbi:nucleotidyltransferase [Stieleria neptunia]|uniref:nucleotidyltransferase n=1 Tax=Stieleria neptunia TaxID=2527979 RepID=UPI0018D226C1|nr:nucleotidyltransferase [Stieleria neptunia]